MTLSAAFSETQSWTGWHLKIIFQLFYVTILRATVQRERSEDRLSQTHLPWIRAALFKLWIISGSWNQFSILKNRNRIDYNIKYHGVLHIIRMFGYLLLHNKSNPKFSGLKAFTCSLFWNLGRACRRQLSFAPWASAGVAQLGLKDPFPRCFIHMAGKLVLPISWELNRDGQLGPWYTYKWPLHMASLGFHKMISGFPGAHLKCKPSKKTNPNV